jgi:hypothetical protein
MLLERLVLEKGRHGKAGGYCIMEAASVLADEPKSEAPRCVCPTIAALLRGWSDSLEPADRQKLKPLIPKVLDTNKGNSVALQRALLAGDFAARVHLAKWLEAAGEQELSARLSGAPAFEVFSFTGPVREAIAEAIPKGKAALAELSASGWTDATSDVWTAAWQASQRSGRSALRTAAASPAWELIWASMEAAGWRAVEIVARRGASGADSPYEAAAAALAPTVEVLWGEMFGLVETLISV